MKKFILFLLFGLFISFLGNAQSDSLQKKSDNENDQIIFIHTDIEPEFIGGEKAMIDWLSKSLRYPILAKDDKIEGKVYVSFVVDTDGSITDVNIVKSVNELLDKEAKRVIESMPKWKPGKQNGTIVRVKYTIPIIFKL